ncbi:MAG: hypothetical protein F4114_17390 [Rhodospirillaceae bacterium]|nr:hypothetical protein [Rhodospirillaceae bacterium]MYI50844.1 hypothetical protein [Rhodospirillaceae bacterium]
MGRTSASGRPGRRRSRCRRRRPRPSRAGCARSPRPSRDGCRRTGCRWWRPAPSRRRWRSR